ncbi:hypothetical protein QFZ31_001203 [Neobacillus niacini]|uniref:hypothetical protein n=1 Tax=Neobacillus driksii TaxID=3035913 RepID=UPI0027818A9C|nr:hypothetical protein [Neobacillus niacini]MDQ0971325.1 hypothetical protein [Neobacillus niacini]
MTSLLVDNPKIGEEALELIWENGENCWRISRNFFFGHALVTLIYWSIHSLFNELLKLMSGFFL